MSNSRQAIYDRIRRAGGKQQYILEEMVRLGFWGRSSGAPQDPATEVERRGQILRELQALRTHQSATRDRVRLLRDLRKQRMAESKRRRLEKKEQRERERQARAASWRAYLHQHIPYLGRRVSGGLGREDSRVERLRTLGLPVARTAGELSQAMRLPVAQLRFLAFDRRVSRHTHYVRFRIPKRTGGERLISAPMPRLKAAQHWILEHVLAPLDGNLHDAAHGFRPGRSIVTNARPHLGQDVVVNLDLADFFPTITRRRVKGLFVALGYSEALATILSLLCTEADLAETSLDGRTWYVQRGERTLPQGAPTSPALTNHLCKKLDRRLTGLAAHYGFTYTRYADDLTFSGSGSAAHRVAGLLHGVRHIVEDEGFAVHPDKTRVQRRGSRQEVTGLIVNDPRRLTVDRRTVRRLRAVLFQIEKDGPAGKSFAGYRGPALLDVLLGYADFIHMVDPDRGGPLRDRVLALRTQRPTVLERTRAATASPGQEPAPIQPDAPPPAVDEEDNDDDDGNDDGSSGGGDGKWWKVF